MAQQTITIAFAGGGDIDQKAVDDHLSDWLGYEPDEDDVLTSDIDVEVVIPASAASFTPSLAKVVKWVDAVDAPYTVVTDDPDSRDYRKLFRNAQDIEETTNVAAGLISTLEKAKGEKYLVLLWGEDGDDFSDILLDLATTAQIPIKDLTEGLDDLVLADEEDPEIEEEPPMAKTTKKKASEEPLEEPEIPLEEETSTPDVVAVLGEVYEYLYHRDYADSSRNRGDLFLSPLTELVSSTLEALRGAVVAEPVVEAPAATETPETPAPVAEDTPAAEAPVRRGRGRPRKDGSTEPKTETFSYILDGEGNYRKRGRGRLKRGEEAVQLTAEQIAELGLEAE